MLPTKPNPLPAGAVPLADLPVWLRRARPHARHYPGYALLYRNAIDGTFPSERAGRTRYVPAEAKADVLALFFPEGEDATQD